MDITHVPRYIKCFVCGQSDDEYHMIEVDKERFIHDPECVEEYSNWLRSEWDYWRMI